MLIELMKDPSVVVRDTTAWTVGRICELLPEAAINDMYLAPLLQCLIEGLGAEPRVASNVCWVSCLSVMRTIVKLFDFSLMPIHVKNEVESYKHVTKPWFS